ncbi:uncharacterized protein [Chiloscyllium punctatum]|uniref:uncharacterized protein n=1 Tax=Chiloscyllium punctatum TaxID=137246 RepID=UPI003B63EA38
MCPGAGACTDTITSVMAGGLGNSTGGRLEDGLNGHIVSLQAASWLRGKRMESSAIGRKPGRRDKSCCKEQRRRRLGPHQRAACLGLDVYAQTVRKYINARFIRCTHKVEQNVTASQHNVNQTLKNNHNIVIKPAAKGGAIVLQNRTDHCKEVYRQLNNQEHYRQLPADPTKEHTRELNTLIRTLDPVLQSSLHALILCTSHVGDFYCLPKVHKANTPERPTVSGNGTLCENLSGCVEGILKPTVQGISSFCRDTTDFLQKLSTQGPVETGTFFVTTSHILPHSTPASPTRMASQQQPQYSTPTTASLQTPSYNSSALSSIITSSSLTNNSSSRHMEQPWGPNLHPNMPTFLCTGSNKTSSLCRISNQNCTPGTLMTFSSSGPMARNH